VTKRFFVEGLPTQSVFGFDSTKGNRPTGTDSDVNILDHILCTLNPYSTIQNRKGYALRTHDAPKTGSLSLSNLGKIKANDELFTFIERRFARAEVGDIIQPSPVRVEAPCPHYIQDHCGGCQLQHLAYDAQLAAKRARSSSRNTSRPPTIGEFA